MRQKNTEAVQCPYCTLKMHCSKHRGATAPKPKDMHGSLDRLYDELVASRLSRYEQTATNRPESTLDGKWREALASAKADRKHKAERPVPKKVDVGSNDRPKRRRRSADSDSSRSDTENRKSKKRKKKDRKGASSSGAT